jgi:hypothetical protein
MRSTIARPSAPSQPLLDPPDGMSPYHTAPRTHLLLDLPSDVFNAIFIARLGCGEVVAYAQTCTRAREQAQSEALWQALCTRDCAMSPCQPPRPLESWRARYMRCLLEQTTRELIELYEYVGMARSLRAQHLLDALTFRQRTESFERMYPQHDGLHFLAQFVREELDDAERGIREAGVEIATLDREVAELSSRVNWMRESMSINASTRSDAASGPPRKSGVQRGL